MVSYPITDFVFETDDKDAKKLYQDLFDAIGMKNILTRLGIDYFVLGNAFFSMSMPFTRFLQCPDCGTMVTIKEAKNFKVKGKSTFMFCPKCQKQVKATVKDTQTKNFSDIHTILWDPMNMKIEHDDIFDVDTYLYSIPGTVAHDLEVGNQNAWKLYPMQIINSAFDKKYFEPYPSKILHLKRLTHSASYNKGYGQPIISPVLKYLFHLLVLMRAQDALAIDQILPWTILSPSSNGSIDPAGDINLSQYSSSLQKEYSEWKKNPMRKSIMPIPVNAQIVGAQGKALMLTNEIQEITNQVLAGMSVPNEFVYGGLQWSGANISMRMLENQFMNYRRMMQQAIDMVVRECSIYFGLPKIKVYMQPFKMADDIAQKDLLLRLGDAGIISKHTIMNELMSHLDYDKEQEMIKRETASDQEDLINQQIVRQNAQAAYGVDIGGGMPGEEGAVDDGTQHGDLPEDRPPQAEGGNQQV